MKKLAAVVALATLVASPALAQTSKDHLADASYQRTATVPWDAVVNENKVIGQDPDANVRLDLRRGEMSINH
jgi:hypothetical protein